jgi:choline dehydrogenase
MQEASLEETYEYIVVGSGAGGGPLAANLALAGHTVLVLEAGGSPKAEDSAEAYNCRVPAFHPNASEEPGMSWRFFVRHYADEEQQKKDCKYVPEEDGIFYPRAGTLGGCTAHNAMILVYPHNSDWDRIAELTGDKSWNAKAMRRYYVRLEECRYRGILRFLFRHLRWNPSRHGFAGWLASETPAIKLLLEDRALLWLVRWSALKNLFTFRSGSGLWQDFKQAVKQLAFSVITWFDPNSWWSVVRRSEGFRMTPLSRNVGCRAGSRDRLLAARKELTEKGRPEGLTLRPGALATRVLFDDDQRAVGVEYLEGAHLYRADAQHQPGEEGTVRQVRASREVILAGGAFNTPQLLQLSGIGPADLLRRRGIPVRVDLPGVGANLQDRYEVTVVLRMDKPFSSFKDATLKPPVPGGTPDPQFTQWLEGQGVYTTNGAVMSFIKRSRPELPDPDLFLFGLVTDFRGYYPGYSKRIQEARRYFTWAVLKGSTHNTAGTVQIRSADPRDVPCINFHYFDEGSEGWKEDLDAVVHALEFILGITKGYGRRIDEEEAPGKQKHSRKDLEEYVRNQAWGHHASCTCKIGSDGDPAAVLDSDFRVRGTKCLRVVDASVFPRIPGLFIVSAVYMISEKASDVILRDAKRSLSCEEVA